MLVLATANNNKIINKCDSQHTPLELFIIGTKFSIYSSSIVVSAFLAFGLARVVVSKQYYSGYYNYTL